MGWLFSDIAYELTPRNGDTLPYHRFQAGDFVFVSRNGVSSGEVYEGSVVTRTKSRLIVTMTAPIRAPTTGVWVCFVFLFPIPPSSPFLTMTTVVFFLLSPIRDLTEEMTK